MERRLNLTFKGIDLEVVGYYDQGECGVMYDSDLGGLPETYASFDINEVYLKDSEVNIFELFSYGDLTIIEELILEKFDNSHT